MFGKNVPPPKGRKPNGLNPRGVPMFGKNVLGTLVAAGACWAALGVMRVIVSAPASANPASHRALIVILLMVTVFEPINRWAGHLVLFPRFCLRDVLSRYHPHRNPDDRIASLIRPAGTCLRGHRLQPSQEVEVPVDLLVVF